MVPLDTAVFRQSKMREGAYDNACSTSTATTMLADLSLPYIPETSPQVSTMFEEKVGDPAVVLCS